MTKKKLFKLVLCIVVLIVAIDLGMGWCMGAYVRRCEIPGDYKKIEYMLKHVDVQILLLGASTCMNSVDPMMIEKDLGKTAFNGGLNSQRLELFDIMCDAAFKHSHPELLILVLRKNDLTTDDIGRLAMLNIYYGLGNTKIDDYLNEGNLKKKLLMSSSLYRFNTYWWRILLYHFKSFNELAHGGFLGKPVLKYLPSPMEAQPAEKNELPDVNPHKIQCLENILATCRKAGARLWIVIAPEYGTGDADSGDVTHIRSFCEKNGIPFWNDLYHPDYADHPEYFYDNFHLNNNGARLYTRLMMKRLQTEGI